MAQWFLDPGYKQGLDENNKKRFLDKIRMLLNASFFNYRSKCC